MAVFRVCILQFPCVILFSLFSLGFTFVDPPYTICGAANYDVWNLTSNLWRFSLPEEDCLRHKNASHTSVGCNMTMAFCRSVNLTLPCAQSAVCLSFDLPGNDSYNMASYKGHSNPFNTAPLISGVGFTTQFESGESYKKDDGTVSKLNTVMTFRCNMQASWITDGMDKVMTVPASARPSVQVIKGATEYTYNVTFDFAGACPMVSPSQPVSQLSPGSVLLIIFFVAATAYFMTGVLINILRGQSGANLLPHSEFWTALPGYIRDGCAFSTSCGERSSGRQTYESI